MKKTILLLALLLCAPLKPLLAQAPAGLSLDQYLEQVKTRNGQVHATIQNVQALEMRLREAEVVLVPELYAEYGHLHDERQPANPFMADRTIGSEWTAGLRKQTTFGLGADLFFSSRHTNIHGNFPAGFQTDYYDKAATLQLTQSLWRNGFGESTRAQVEAGRAATEIELLTARFQLKNLLLEAENTYWSLVSLQEIVKLQKENVDRGRKLYDWMAKRTRLRLYDDVDSMQAKASLETRELELQMSLDDQASLARRFNTLRGVSSDTVENLDDLPNSKGMMDATKTGSREFTREDFEILRVQARAAMARATASASAAKPKVDLIGSYSTNGHDLQSGGAYQEVKSTAYPMWQVGVSVAVPLDFGLMGDLKRSQRMTKAAASELESHAKFSEARAWEDFNKQKNELRGRYERAISLEKLQTQLVKSERQRLLNGRTTTFQLSTFEQNLAGAQVQRIRAQLSLLQLHNVLKQFTERQ